MKRVLMLASVASMIDQFNMPNIELLQTLGYEVDVACNFADGNTCSEKQIIELKDRLANRNVKYYQIDFTRSVMNFKQDFIAYQQVKKLLQEKKYDFVHCHSPIGGAIGRVACHKMKTKVIYTAHGFHFYKGAPKKNWLLYYPIEKLLSNWTDCLITINKEDYQLAQKEFAMRKLVYSPGIGVNSHRDKVNSERVCELRSQYANEREILFLSVGELNKNKNHQSVILALRQLQIPYKYVICGKGDMQKQLEQMVEENNMQDKIFFAGFCPNIKEYLAMADVFCFPSYREGLSVALMEAMVYGLPVICSKIRGNVDLIDEKGGIFFEPNSVESIKMAIDSIAEKREEWNRMGTYNRQKIVQFDSEKVKQIMEKVYSEL